MRNKLNSYLEEKRIRSERFKCLSSDDKLEYYTRFDNISLWILGWRNYFIFFLMQSLAMLSFYINYTAGYASASQFYEFWAFFIALSKIALFVAIVEITVSLFSAGYNFYSERKWLKDKGIIRK